MGLLHARDTAVRIDFLEVKWHENYDGHIKKVWNTLLTAQFALLGTRFFKFPASGGSFLTETINGNSRLFPVN